MLPALPTRPTGDRAGRRAQRAGGAVVILHPRFDARWPSLSDHERDVVIAAYWRSRGIEVPDAEVDRWKLCNARSGNSHRPRYQIRDNVGMGMFCGSYGR